jgi:hypothetical protein
VSRRALSCRVETQQRFFASREQIQQIVAAAEEPYHRLQISHLSIAENPNLPDLIATPPLRRRFTSDGVASTCRMHRVNRRRCTRDLVPTFPCTGLSEGVYADVWVALLGSLPASREEVGYLAFLRNRRAISRLSERQTCHLLPQISDKSVPSPSWTFAGILVSEQRV